MPFRNGMTDEPARMEWNEERAFEPLFLKIDAECNDFLSLIIIVKLTK